MERSILSTDMREKVDSDFPVRGDAKRLGDCWRKQVLFIDVSCRERLRRARNSRWKKEVKSDSPTTKIFEVTGVQDDLHGITAFIDAVDPLSIQWRQHGMPGFSYRSIIIGVIVGTLLSLGMRKRV